MHLLQSVSLSESWLILSMPHSTTAIVFTLSSVLWIIHNLLSLKNGNTLFESCYSLINLFFFVNSLFFGSCWLLWSYICWRRSEILSTWFLALAYDWWMWQVYEWKRKLKVPGSLSLKRKNRAAYLMQPSVICTNGPNDAKALWHVNHDMLFMVNTSLHVVSFFLSSKRSRKII